MMQDGFSLLELSIVLVIIGLLAGGVMTGQSLIRAAELRAVSTEYQRFLTANNAFKDKYRALPGDMKNATAFWGKDATNCNGDTGTAGSPGVCNGNGDGIVGIYAPGGPSTVSDGFQAFRHMALAGVIEGNYTGIAGPLASIDCIGGTNVPTSKFPNAGWYLNWDNPPPAGSSTTFNVDNGNHLGFGGLQRYNVPSAPILTPAEAWNIDSKLDDGRPAYGRVIGTYWNNLCTAPDSGTASKDNLNASYRLSDSSAQCFLLFVRIN